jgi:nucleotide-binding universal stress UspA family protein
LPNITTAQRIVVPFEEWPSLVHHRDLVIHRRELPSRDEEPMPQDSSPIIGSILHPSDFSDESDVAFAHALKAALIAHSQLTIMHVSPKATEEWTDFPGVREVLARWGLLPKDAPRSAVPALGIDVRKVSARHNDPVESVLAFLDHHPADLIVLATHQHEGRSHWMHRSVSEPIARNSGQMTLFIPPGVDGFVSRIDGTVSLRSVLIPIAPVPLPQPALVLAARLVRNLQCPEGTFTTLWVGAGGDAPAVHFPETPGWKWNAMVQSGDVIEAIVNAARDTSADLIVMATDGRHGFLDALRGSHSERVLRRTPCPLLAIPVSADATAMVDE